MLKIPSEALEKYSNVDKMSHKHVYVHKNIKSPSFLQAFTKSTLNFVSEFSHNQLYFHAIVQFLQNDFLDITIVKSVSF